MEDKKCVIIGCGFVGTTIAFTLQKSGIYNNIVLIDIDKKKSEGEAMDLSHCNPFIKPVNIYSGEYSDVKGASIVIITAGANQKPDESRLDLVNKNIKIYESIIPKIVEQNDKCILLCVSNPVDILTYAALKISKFPPEKVIGSGTVLDTARLKFMLSEHLNIDSRNVHAFIIGEHGDSELAIWSSANISGIDIKDFCKTCKKCSDMETMHEIYEDVKNSAYEIIEKKGATYYGIALAVLRIVEAIERDENSILTVSSYVNGHYGIEGLCIGLPSIVGKYGVKQIIDIPLDETERKFLIKSVEMLRSVINDIEL